MASLFCSGAISTAVKLAANGTGIAIAANNKALATDLMPVALELKAKVDGGSDNGVLNGLIQQGITYLVGKVSNSPIIMAEANIVLSAIGFDIANKKFPVLPNAQIVELVDAFVAGLQAGAAS